MVVYSNLGTTKLEYTLLKEMGIQKNLYATV